MDDTTDYREESVFSVKTEVFEGPLDLLLDLVEKRKLLINDISLAEVTDEYMSHVQAMQQASLPGTTQFVQLAATLLLIKSKSLLPSLDLSESEESNIEELEERLRHYQIYRRAATELEESFGSKYMYSRQFVPRKQVVFAPDEYTSLNSLSEALSELVQNLPKEEKKPKAEVKKVISLEDMMERLEKRIREKMSFKFEELTEGDKEPTTVIVGFLAVLEAIRQGQVLVKQQERFKDIEIYQEIQAPQYH